jgi:putative nucleotidyltransferase with HDIG domain
VGRRAAHQLVLQTMARPSRLILFIGALAVLAALLVAGARSWSAPVASFWAPTLILAICGLVLEFIEVPTPRNGTLSVSGVAHVATILVAPPPWGALAVGGAVLAHQLVQRRPAARIVFNVANHVVTVSIASMAVGAIGAPPLLLTDQAIPLGYIAAAVAALTYYGLNVGLTATVISLATGRRFGYVLAINNRSTLLPDLGAGTLGVLLAASWYAMPAWVVLLGVPTAVIARTLQVIRRLERETVEAVETLADSIDERDPTTFHHSARVSQYATCLAEAMEVDDPLVDLISLAARVHDLGKMGVTDTVLMKTGRLDATEAEKMRRHPEIGARILGRYQLYRDGAKLVRSHHERWDGRGYPDGLAGERIPLGARIIAAADAFDAMTSDRPYRDGLDPRQALDELRRGAGAQWDPVVVAHFVRLLTDPAAELPDTPAISRLRTPGLQPVTAHTLDLRPPLESGTDGLPFRRPVPTRAPTGGGPGPGVELEEAS